MIRVLLVDDQVIICEGLEVVLNASQTIQVVGMAHDGNVGVRLVEQQQPDVVLMDLKMPRMNGIRATEVIKQQFPQIAVLILTTYDEDDWVVDAIRAGANGYLLKDANSEEIIAAIEGVVAGETPVDPAIAQKLYRYVQFGVPARSEIVERLTERELAILRLLASGLTNAVIAERLSLAEGTVRNHITAIFSKLEVSDRAQATAVAWRYGLVQA